MSDTADKQEAMQRIRDRLAVHYRTHEIGIWLRSPHPQLKGRRACDLILSGREAEVHRIIDRMDEGAYL